MILEGHLGKLQVRLVGTLSQSARGVDSSGTRLPGLITQSHQKRTSCSPTRMFFSSQREDSLDGYPSQVLDCCPKQV